VSANPAAGTTARRGQTVGRHVCPVCAGRFDVSQLLPTLHLKNAPPRRFQRLAHCCPHCKAVLRSRYEWRAALPVLSGAWLLLILTRMISNWPGPALKDRIMLGLLGAGVVYHSVALICRWRDPHAFVRDTRLDPPPG